MQTLRARIFLACLAALPVLLLAAEALAQRRPPG